MPHPMRGLSKTTIVAIAIIKKAKDIKMVLLCAINPKETQRFQELYRKIVRMVEDPALFNRLYTSTTFDEFTLIFNDL